VSGSCARNGRTPRAAFRSLDHIRELRNRIVKILLALAAGMIVGFVFFTPVWKVIEHPLCSAVIRGDHGCATLGVNQLALNGPLDS
jgi:Sec-independent protein secretion pathway component TatC